MFDKFYSKLYSFLFSKANDYKLKEYRRKFKIHKTTRLNYPENIWFSGNVEVGANTYINGGRFVSGPNTSIKIGEWCAIGHNVNIIGLTHDIEVSTGPISERPVHEKNVTIGNHVWIGTNVFIKEGVSIGNNAIIGANSVVIRDIPDNAICGGIPAKIIKYKKVND